MVMGLRTIELTDGGLLLYDEAFLPPKLSDRYFIELRDNCVWEQKPGVQGFHNDFICVYQGFSWLIRGQFSCCPCA